MVQLFVVVRQIILLVQGLVVAVGKVDENFWHESYQSGRVKLYRYYKRRSRKSSVTL